jgi:hypothetical protein
VDVATMPRTYGAALPDWVFDELAAAPGALPTAESRMALVHRLAARNPREGSGGPYGATLWSGGKRLVTCRARSPWRCSPPTAHGRMAAERGLTVYNARGRT